MRSFEMLVNSRLEHFHNDLLQLDQTIDSDLDFLKMELYTKFLLYYTELFSCLASSTSFSYTKLKMQLEY